MVITSTVCDVCRQPLGNKLAIAIDGKWICGFHCGIQAFGKEKYLEHWEKEASHRLKRSRSNVKAFRAIK